jgi:hypothetical protein
VIRLNISLPLWLILAALVWFAWRYMSLRVWHAAVCLLLGFLLAATAAAPEIRHIVHAILRSHT